jgi:hypothetical protein
MQLLQQAHPCQTAGGEADELGVDDEADHDEALWEAVSELLTSLPKVMGAAYYSLPTAKYQLPTANHQLLTAPY